METRTGTQTIFARALRGVAASVFATVPLAIGFALQGVFSSADEFSALAIVLGTALTVIVALLVSTVSAVVFGVPIYVLTARTKVPRAFVLVVAAALTGVIVHELWNGGELFEDIGSMLLFASFGAYSGAAFWLGADVWSRA